MIPTTKRIEAAKRLIKNQRANIAFYKERIKAQADPDYNPYPNPEAEKWSIRQRKYYPVDVELAQNRLRGYYSVLGECQALLHIENNH